MNRIIPYGHQCIDRHDIECVVNVLRSGFITQGPKIKEFEDALCRYTGAKYAVCVSSGTAALHIAVLALGISRRDEVITAPITFLASSNCVLYCQGKPVFADVFPDSGNINPEKIQEKINKNTKVIIPVHFGGQPCDLRSINKISQKYKVVVVEDAAHALGADYHGSKIGSCKYSEMTIFSFHPVKSITTGEGGAVLTNSRKLYKKLLVLRAHGITREKLNFKIHGNWYYQMKTLGYNYRLTDIQAALGISQIRKLDFFISRRREIAKKYNRIFCANPYFDIPPEDASPGSVFHLYPILLKAKYVRQKKIVFDRLRKKNIGVQVHYIPVYLQPYYRSLGYKPGFCPVSEEFYRREISLPIYPSLTEAEIKYVSSVVLRVFERPR